MDRRLQFHNILVTILGSENVYFQPPPNIIMRYPCILYKRDFESASFADNIKYRKRKRYLVTYMDTNPDSNVPDLLSEVPFSTFDRFFTSDNLNHDVYKIFF